jgi:hypothetical protein
MMGVALLGMLGGAAVGMTGAINPEFLLDRHLKGAVA